MHQDLSPNVDELVRVRGGTKPLYRCPFCYAHYGVTEPTVIGPLSIDPVLREARLDGDKVKLEPKPFDLLVVLARRPGVMVATEALIGALDLEDNEDPVRHVAVLVWAVRKAIGHNAIRTHGDRYEGGYSLDAIGLACSLEPSGVKPQSRSLWRILTASPGRMISCDDLMAGARIGNRDVLRQRVLELRKVLPAGVIRSRRNYGYCWHPNEDAI